jgi:hypothetical protein
MDGILADWKFDQEWKLLKRPNGFQLQNLYNGVDHLNGRRAMHQR